MKWKKKNGNEITTNDDKATIDYMTSLGAEVIEGPAVPQDEPPADDPPGDDAGPSAA